MIVRTIYLRAKDDTGLVSETANINVSVPD